MPVLEELDNLFKEIQDNRKTLQVAENISLDEMVKLCDVSPQMTSVVEVFKYSMSIVYANENAENYLKITSKKSVKSGFEFFLNFLHPQNISSIYLFINFFNHINSTQKVFSNTYYVKSKNIWEWIYNCMKPVIYNDDGTVKYMLSVSSTLNDYIQSHEQRKEIKKNLNFYEDNIDKYLSLTVREKEVFKLIADELTPEDIADILSVSNVAVHTDRKNLIKKFDVNNTIGLAKFAMLFNLK